MKKSYWFYIEPYVHLATNGSTALVYNALDGKFSEYNDPAIVKLIKKLKSKKNLLVVKLSAHRLTDPNILTFVREIKAHYSGDLIDTSYSRGKPFQMMPQVKIQKDIEKSRAVGEKAIGEGIMEYLKEITLYINNSCQCNCSFCRDGYKQFMVCSKNRGSGKQELEIEKVKQLFKEVGGSSVFRINISGGNIFMYSKFAGLVDVLNSIPLVKTYHVYYSNLPGRETEIQWLKSDRSYINIYVDFPVRERELENVADMSADPDLNCEFDFILQKQEDIGSAQEIATRLKIDNVVFKPLYNRENYDFFQGNVFVNKEDLAQARPGLKDIYARTKVNPVHFGRITVLSNGAIYANVNRGKIGELNRNTLFDAVLREIYKGNSWINPRVRVNPCKSCNYALLCPPISNYEYVLEKNNMCNIPISQCRHM